jgi:4-amino-4-deoxy-L-arabinose transferase-like glycosyltransferase
MMVRLVEHKHFVFFCLGASIFVRLLWVAFVFSYPVSDFEWYYLRGWDMAIGNGYAINGVPTAYWPVGYPAFLSLIFRVFGFNLVFVKLANVFLYTGILYLSYVITRRLFSSELTARMAMLLLAFFPNHIAYSSLVSTETLFLFLFLLGAAALLLGSGKFRVAVPAGMVFGLACLVKPQTLFIPLLIILVYYSRRVDTRRLFTMLLTVYLVLGAVLLPWIIRNYYVFNTLIFISNNGGVTLFIGNNPYANGTYMHFSDELAGLLDLGPDDDEHDVDVKARKYAIKYMIDHPVKTLKLCVVKLIYLYREDVDGVNWNNDERIIDENRGDSSEAFFGFYTSLAQNYYIIIMIGFIVYLILLLKGGGPVPVPTVGLWIIAYFTVIYMVIIGISRFHFPLIPWILMYVSSLVDWAASRLGIEVHR